MVFFYCKRCKKPFYVKRDYEKHIKRATPCAINHNPIPTPETFPCNKCGVIFNLKSRRNEHSIKCKEKNNENINTANVNTNNDNKKTIIDNQNSINNHININKQPININIFMSQKDEK